MNEGLLGKIANYSILIATYSTLLGIIVIVVVIAITGFFGSYPPKTYFSEAKSHLGAIRSTQAAYFTEHGVYVGGQTLTPLPDRRHHPEKTKWDENTRFSIIGFAPEGDVFFSYALEGPPWSTSGFTAIAVGDIDNDGSVEIFRITNDSYEITRTGDDEVRRALRRGCSGNRR